MSIYSDIGALRVVKPRVLWADAQERKKRGKREKGLFVIVCDLVLIIVLLVF